ncbi:transferrin isoform X2 [Neodiprion virginianus]|uniref:transferrin isoform X2 n=1 Tax=Neodiprion virginianus TaxID=2961670 RepID=UPI001EE6C02F|nr:transferrin isoform X2 [Neodiprion virginianus]
MARLTGVIIITSMYSYAYNKRKVRLCMVSGKHTDNRIKKNCPMLDEPQSGVKCVITNDRFDCLRKVGEELSDLTVLGPEDLAAAASSREFNILVTNELKFFPEEKYQYQIIALFRTTSGIQDLRDVRGKKFCHPGYESAIDWTPVLATYFENTIIEKECDPNKTLIENRVAAASKFFGAACMPGPWTTDTNLDSKLKSRYRNLCAICDNPAGCYSDDKYHGRIGAVMCLADGIGDIAWVRIADAQEYFRTQGINKGDYRYLCYDGTTRSMQTEEPCPWIAKPWPVVVTNSNQNEKVFNLMMTLDTQNVPWHGALVRLLENYHLAQINRDDSGTPGDYLRRVPGFLSANTHTPCKPSRTIQWCVSSNVEQRKCMWLRQALSVYGDEPNLSCIARTSRMACMEAVTQQEAELFVIRPDEELVAKQKGLKRVVHVFTNKIEDMNKVAAVVRRDSKINNLEQLRGLKACFTGYQTIGWNAFVSIMRNMSGSNWDPLDIKAVSNFFKESCVPGLKENSFKIHTFPSNLYSLCKEGAEYKDETSAFRCLVNGGGDVAFISADTVKKNTGNQNQQTWAHGLKGSDFKPICFKESDPDSCFLTWTTLGSVMVNQNISSIRFEEIYSTLLEMDQLFGKTYNGQTPAFLLYGSYDGNHSIIFPGLHCGKRFNTTVSYLGFLSPARFASMFVVESICGSSSSSFSQLRDGDGVGVGISEPGDRIDIRDSTAKLCAPFSASKM